MADREGDFVTHIPQRLLIGCALLLCLMLSNHTTAQTLPPYAGTVYLDPGWIVPEDLTSLTAVTYRGQEFATLFDRRVNAYRYVLTYSYTLNFNNQLSVVARVNTEFSQEEAPGIAETWGNVLGQLPLGLLEGLGELHLQPGDQLMGGNDATNPTHVLIHTVHGDRNLSLGWAEEEVLHELAHAVLQHLQSTSAWLDAQSSDNCSISSYAADYPTQEDVAESLAPYLALKLRPERVRVSDQQKISDCIPARIAVFDSYFGSNNIDLYPWVSTEFQEGKLVGYRFWLLRWLEENR
jgi:hypothetical protein